MASEGGYKMHGKEYANSKCPIKENNGTQLGPKASRNLLVPKNPYQVAQRG